MQFELIPRNPFAGFKIRQPVSRDRHVMITRDTIHQIIDKGTDPRWRCLLGFAGLCGLRVRSEVDAIRWEHVHWDDNVMTIPAAKTPAERALSLATSVRTWKPGTQQLLVVILWPYPLGRSSHDAQARRN